MGDKLTRNQIKKLSTGYFLHDIGMTRIPMQIIEKPERLSDLEWNLIRMHPVWAMRVSERPFPEHRGHEHHPDAP